MAWADGKRKPRGGLGCDIGTCGIALAACLLCFGVGMFAGYHVYSAPSSTASSSLESLATSLNPSSSQPESLDDSKAPAGGAVASSSSSSGGGSSGSSDGKACSNTCKLARNGVCNEGRSGLVDSRTEVFCDLGTDCDDCGPWEGQRAVQWPGTRSGPIGFLRSSGVQVFVRRTRTVPAFDMLHTDPKADLDVSQAVDRDGMIEAGITKIFYLLLNNTCLHPNGTRKLVVDVGANFGYFTVYAAKMGCRVVAWEPVPLFRAMIQHALRINGVAHLVDLRDKVVGPNEGEEVTVMVPQQGIWGTASVSGLNSDFPDYNSTSVKVKTESIDSVVQEDVALLKVDVEGFEPYVFKSASALLYKHDVANIVMEYNAGIAERVLWMKESHAHKDLVEAFPQLVLKLIVLGYKIGQMSDNIAKGGNIDWAAPFAELPEVTAENIKYDMQDAYVYREGVLNNLNGKGQSKGLQCPPPKELVDINKESWESCNQSPEDVHPKSLRSMFPFNTNLWATKGSKHFKLSGPVGIFAMSQDASKEWTSTKDPTHGSGMRSCKHLPARDMVRNRCSCSFSGIKHFPETVPHTAEETAACKAEEARAMELLKAGRLKFAP